VRARTLFATHYHELTTLADHLPRVANVHVAVDERDGEVTFLRTVRDGPTNRSYGVHVADLAGVPDPVVSRADEVLDRLREEKAIEARGSRSGGNGDGGASGGDGGDTQQVVFDLSSGSFSGGGDAEEATADQPGSKASRNGAAAETPEPAETAVADRLDPETRAVIEELSDVDVAATPPVELLSRVQEWQDRLE
jgi:DNA mismatch repair protein MutS